MKPVAKIILGFSLIALAACSGKGSGESRINNIDNDVEDSGSPAVINGDDNQGLTGNTIACIDESESYCAETTDMSLKSQCDPSDGDKLLDKCPAGGTKCNITGLPVKATFYAYEGKMTCEMLQQFMNGSDDDDDMDW